MKKTSYLIRYTNRKNWKLKLKNEFDDIEKAKNFWITTKWFSIFTQWVDDERWNGQSMLPCYVWTFWKINEC